MAGPLKSLLLVCVVAEFVSLSSWGHLQTARGWSQLPFDNIIRVSSPSPVVRTKVSSPAESYLERQSQLSQDQRRAGRSQHVHLCSPLMVLMTAKVTQARIINQERFYKSNTTNTMAIRIHHLHDIIKSS